MADVLSQLEIDSLLNAITTGEVTTEELHEREENRSIKPYDFRHPSKFSKEQINFFELIYDNYARAVSGFLSAQLRVSVQVSVTSIEQLTYGEFARSLPDPSVLVVYDLDPLQGNGILDLQPGLVFCMLDRLLGGSGNCAETNRTLTEIESSLIKQLAQQMLDISREAWENIVDMQPKIELIEFNPQFAQIVSYSEMVILVSLAVRVDEAEGILNFCLPYISLEPILDRMSVHNWFAKGMREENPQERQFLEEQLESMSVPVKAVLGETAITVRELLEIDVGDVVFIDRKVDQDIHLHVDECCKFIAKPGQKKNFFAAEVTGIIGEGGVSVE